MGAQSQERKQRGTEQFAESTLRELAHVIANNSCPALRYVFLPDGITAEAEDMMRGMLQ